MIRFLFLLALFWAVSKLFKVFGATPRRASPLDPFRPAPPRVDGGELVQDPHCGVYVPKATALRGKSGDFYCSETCRSAAEIRNG